MPANAPPFAPHHEAVRAETRAWIAREVTPYVEEWEAAGECPREVYRSAGQAGLLGWKYPPELGGRGVDLLADLAVNEELALCGCSGVGAAIGASKDLSPYYVGRFGTDEQRNRWLRPCIRGEQLAGLAVTEPGAGSDVASLRTRAVPDGAGGWVVSGSKVFITNGPRADWLLVAARTSDEPGYRGVSLLLVDTASPGFSASRVATLGWRSSQTGLLGFDEVRVPPGCVLGPVGGGFGLIMQSFQYERIVMAIGAAVTAADDLATCRPWAAGTDLGRWAELARSAAAVRALTYDALTRWLAGEEPVGLVSGAKWAACDLAVRTASLRLALACRAADPLEETRAERALRDARLGPIGGGAREVMAELVARGLDW